MQIQERAFSGPAFRPKPHIYLSSNKKLLTVLTPWGQEATDPKNVFETLESLYGRLSEDKESTHPFPKMMHLTSTQNDMRTAVLQTHQDIFNNINQEEYAMGFELFFATITENIFNFIQIGQPFVFIDRLGTPLQSIGQIMDISINNFGQNQTILPSAETPSPSVGETPSFTKKALPPLPYQLMGIHPDISFSSFCFRFYAEDRIILLSRNAPPPIWFSLKREERTLDNLSQKAAEDNPHTPFWLSVIHLT